MSVSGIGSCGSSQNAAAIQQLQSVIGLRKLTGMKDQPVSGASSTQPSWASASASARSTDTFRSDLASLFSAVQSGDIHGAQAALSTLQSDQAATYGANGRPVTRQTLRQDFASLTQAIQSGDSTGAQKALQSFQQDFQIFQAQHPHHHHHDNGAGLFAPAGNTTSTASLTPAISTTSTDQDGDGDQS